MAGNRSKPLFHFNPKWRCKSVAIHSGTNHLELAHTPQVEGLPYLRHQPRVGAPGHLHFQMTGYKSGRSHNSLRLNNLLEWLAVLRKNTILKIIVSLQRIQISGTNQIKRHTG